jgi:hypothetical protein
MRAPLALAALLLLLTSCRDEYAAIPVLKTQWKVHGKLTDISTGLPIAGAEIDLYRGMIKPSWCTFCELSGVIHVSITSGQDGTYFYSSNVPGYYTMHISNHEFGCKTVFVDVLASRDIKEDIRLNMHRPCPLIL